MSNKETKTTSRESIIAAIRAAVEKNGGKPIGMDTFFTHSKMRRCRFHKFFGGWNEALRAAGFDFIPHGERVPDERLLADWGHVARKLGRAPQSTYYDIHGKFTSQTFKLRFDSYRNVPDAFVKFAKGKREWADVLTLCNKRPRRDRRSCPLTPRERQMRTRPGPRPSPGSKPLPDRPIYGEPIHVQGMSNAPVNETGVVLLFGKLAWDLGFQIEHLRTAFPDCHARRRVGPGAWQDVAIEFEYESRNFRDHGHDPKACDLIICWHHNWPDCPKNLEVIALNEELERLLPHLSRAERDAEGRGRQT